MPNIVNRLVKINDKLQEIRSKYRHLDQTNQLLITENKRLKEELVTTSRTEKDGETNLFSVEDKQRLQDEIDMYISQIDKCIGIVERWDKS